MLPSRRHSGQQVADGDKDGDEVFEEDGDEGVEEDGDEGFEEWDESSTAADMISIAFRLFDNGEGSLSNRLKCQHA